MAKGPGAGPGRPKGSQNKITGDIRTALLNAFEQVGGQAYLVTVAQTDPKTFCTLLGKVLPTQIVGDGDGPVKLEIVWASKG